MIFCINAGAAGYAVTLADVHAHILHVRVHLQGGPAGSTVQLPTWNALYQIRDFSQFVFNLHASDQDGRTVAVRKLDKTTWGIAAANSAVDIDYDIYANQAGPFGAQFNSEHAFLNLAQILVYSVEERGQPVQLSFVGIPEKWQVAIALNFRLQHGDIVYEAEDYDHLVDAPVEIGNFQEDDFSLQGANFRIVVDADVKSYDMKWLDATARKTVTAANDWMQDRPYSSYLFIFHFPHGRGGGGMEHANSTAIEEDADRVARNPLDLEGVIAHEFFHLWNVKRIRPAGLEPINYTAENYTRALWFSEGVDSTVSEILLRRAGIMSEKDYLDQLAAEIRTLQMRPAHHTQSAEESSLDAWLEMYPSYRMTGRSISYYNKGEILGVLLDLEVRRASQDKACLREVFQWMNEHYAKAHKFFPESTGVQQAAEAVTGRDFSRFFRAYVSGVEELPYDELFETVGLKLVQKKTASADAGFDAVRNFDANPIVIAVEEHSDAERTGIVPGDTLLMVNGQSAPRDLVTLLASMNPGDELRLKLSGRKGAREIKLKLGSREELQVSFEELPHATPAQLARRKAWLLGEAQPAIP